MKTFFVTNPTIATTTMMQIGRNTASRMSPSLVEPPLSLPSPPTSSLVGCEEGALEGEGVGAKVCSPRRGAVSWQSVEEGEERK
jgi:hypothetical protein